MSMRVRVFATLRFEAFHRWPNAPKACAYLATRHRHEFHVRVEVVVTHVDRDVEFITLKQKAAHLIESALKSKRTDTWSCERWALYLWRELGATRVEVSEDGENGAFVESPHA